MKDVNFLRNKYGIVVGTISLICNLLLGILKYIIGIFSNSVSIIVDSVNNICDSFSSILIIISFILANKYPSKLYPYGYARYEYIFGLFISIFMIVTEILFFKESMLKIFYNEEISINIFTYLILIIGIIIKYILIKLYIYSSKKLDSNILKTSAFEFVNDIISSFGILLSMFIMKIFNVNLDGYIGIILSIVMLYNSGRMFIEYIERLAGKIFDYKYFDKIKDKLLTYQYVISVHDILVHDYGINNTFISVSIEIDSTYDLIYAHDIIDNIEKDFKKENINLVIHIDPAVVFDKNIYYLERRITNILNKLDNKIKIYNFRVVEYKNYISISFECFIPYDKNYNVEDIILYLDNNIKNSVKYNYNITLKNLLS